VSWNPSSTYLATGSDDLTAKIWDVETRKCLSTLAGHTNYVFCCQFNPWGNILVGRLLARTAASVSHSCAYISGMLPSFQLLLAADTARKHHCSWAVQATSLSRQEYNFTGLCQQGHGLGVCAAMLAWLLQATSSFDETIRFWDVRSGRTIRELPAHSDPITGMHTLLCSWVGGWVGGWVAAWVSGWGSTGRTRCNAACHLACAVWLPGGVKQQDKKFDSPIAAVQAMGPAGKTEHKGDTTMCSP